MDRKKVKGFIIFNPHLIGHWKIVGDDKLEDILDMERVLLFRDLVIAVDKYGMDSAQANAARKAFHDGAETLIGELYDLADKDVREHGGHWTETAEHFKTRAPKIMELLGLREYIFLHAGKGSFRLTLDGQLRPFVKGEAN